MKTAFAFLKDVKPYKTSWKIQVKVLHSWKQYTISNGETFEMILADIKGTKIHGSVKKDLVAKYENKLQEGDWKWIERFGVASAFCKFRTKSLSYKLNFQNDTEVSPAESLSDSYFLSLAKFTDILSEKQNQTILVNVVGQVVNVGEIQTFDINNKQTKKLDLEIRDVDDVRLPCTLWGWFVEQVFKAADKSAGKAVIILLRFRKIHKYKDVISIGNAFDTSQLRINPPYKELEEFSSSLPNDGMILTMLESKPRNQIIKVSDDFCDQYPRRSIVDVLNSTEVGRVKILCTIYAIDTDWSWYYFAHLECNKKVKLIEEDCDIKKTFKARWKCEYCYKIVTNISPRFELHVKIMDHTAETKCLLFDTMAIEIVGQSASSILGGIKEIEDPEDIPTAIKNLFGKTYQFLLCVEKENMINENMDYKVAKVLSKNASLLEEAIEIESDIPPNHASIGRSKVVGFPLEIKDDCG